MRVLLDESVPSDLKPHLVDHEVATVQERGWTGQSNGHLLGLASSQYDALITADQNLPYQQNLTRFEIGVIVLVARHNRLVEYLPLLGRLEEELTKVKPGEARYVGT